MSFQRLLVTGGSGFIGSHLIDAVVASGRDVLNIDIKPPGRADQRAHWRSLDLLDREEVARTVADFKPEAILNLAALADISLGLDQMPVNTVGLENLVRAARAMRVSPRLVHVSTQLVVGPGYDSSGPRDYSPYSEYGKSKAQSEEILWTQGAGLDWTILRPTNVWGPGHPTFAGSTWKYLNRRWYMLPTGSRPIRSYGYVANVVHQMMAAATLSADLVAGKVFYVGDEPIPSAAWLDGFSRALTGKAVRRVPGVLLKLLAEAGELVKRAGGAPPVDRGRFFRITTDYQVAMAPALAVLGTGPASLDEGIAATVGWLRETFPREYRS